jgi:hypothetical protein
MPDPTPPAPPLAAGMTAEAAQTLGMTRPRSCDQIATDIQTGVDELNKRIGEYENDTLMLRFGPTQSTSLESHDLQFTQRQKHLQSLLREWDRGGCGAPNGRFSTQAYSLQSAAAPRYRSPAYDPSGLPQAIVGGGVVLYVVYRVIRMLPSLVFPPSAIPNALVP